MSDVMPQLWTERPSAPENELPEQSLLEAIARGDLDEHLVAISDAVNARQRLLHTVRSAIALSGLCVGDLVRFNDRISPRYLTGTYGVVTAVDERAVAIRLERPIGRFRTGEVHCPPLALDKLTSTGSR